jgi:hypothetical protein
MRVRRARARKAAGRSPASTRARTNGPGRLKAQHVLLNLQQTIGNRAVGGLLGGGAGGQLGGGPSTAPKMPVLSKGDRGEPVRKVQRALADLGFYAPPAKVDGIFGRLTKAAVMSFQSDRGIKNDGVVGPKTAQELKLISQLPVQISIQHNVTLFPQPTNMTCWSAAATMVLGNTQSIGPGKGALSVLGGLVPATVPQFASSHGFTVEPPQSWSVEGLAQLLDTAGPLWITIETPSLHAVVIARIVGDGSLRNTFITIYDPWPPNQGSIWTTSFEQFYVNFPIIYILHK